MRALLLAAGLGTRLHPITEVVPKCLVPIHGRPLISYWLDNLLNAGAVERVVITTHHLAQSVEAYVHSCRWREYIELFYEPTLLGTGGTLAACANLLGPTPILLAHADNLTDFSVSDFSEFHRNRHPRSVMSMLAFRTDSPRSCGILELDKDGLLEAFHEKSENPHGNLANAAVYILENEVLGFVQNNSGAFLDFSTDVIPHFIGRIAVMETTGYHRDIGTPESLQKAHQEFHQT